MFGRLFGSAGRNPGPLDASHATPRDEEMMRRALELAADAAGRGEVPVGAVVYETASGRVLAEASNTREGGCDPAGHAEVVAIRQAATQIGDWRLSSATLVVSLEPCVMCAGLIVNARVGRLVYGCADPKAGGVESLYRLCQDARLNHRITPVGGVMAGESSRMLKEFFRQRRGKND